MFFFVVHIVAGRGRGPWCESPLSYHHLLLAMRRRRKDRETPVVPGFSFPAPPCAPLRAAARDRVPAGAARRAPSGARHARRAPCPARAPRAAAPARIIRCPP